MNKPEQTHRYTPDAVRSLQPDGAVVQGALNPVATQVASQYRRDTMSPVMVSGVLRIVEFVLLAISGLALQALHIGYDTHLAWIYPAIVLATSLLVVIALDMADSYQIQALFRPLSQLGRLIGVWSAAFAFLAVAGFLLKISADFSRLWFVGWFAMGLTLLFVLRLFLARLIRRWARNGVMERRAVIVGGGKAAEDLIRSLEQQPDNDIRICGIFDDRDDRRSPPWSPATRSSAPSPNWSNSPASPASTC